jgi:predicted protein tyrosine phosphatase
MIIRVFNKATFDKNVKDYGVTDGNVESFNDMFFISINDSVGTTPHKPYFKRNHENVLVLHFDDVAEDMTIPIVGDRYVQHVKAFTPEQAEQLYDFIIKNEDKRFCYIHCTAGINRSGSVAKFINDVVGGDYFEFMRLNPHIHGNPLVTRLLNEASVNHELQGEEIDEPRTFTIEQVNEIAREVMNLGMMHRQNQLNGTDGRSGNEVLEDYLDNLNK